MIPLVEVLWHDSFIEGEWKDYAKPTEEDSLTATYGLLVSKDRQWVTLAMTHVPGKSPYWGSLWHIPRGMVKAINTLGEVPEKPRTNEVSINEHPIKPNYNF